MDYEILRHRYEDNGDLTSEEYEYLLGVVVELIKSGSEIDRVDKDVLMESGYEYDCDIEDVGRHGWIEWFGIYKLGDRYFRMTYYSHDDRGLDYDDDETILTEVFPKEVMVTKWFTEGEL